MSEEYGPNERPALKLTETAKQEIKATRAIRGYHITSAGLREIRQQTKQESAK